MRALMEAGAIIDRNAVATVFVCAAAVSLQADNLDTLFSRGDSSIAITWTPDSNNTRVEWYRTNGSKCTGVDSIYTHCDFLPGETYRSVAYSYGGEDGHLRFREKLAAGFLVGSHLCHYTTFGDPSPAVAGTDCSGFVCYLWDVPRVSTRELHADYTVITREELDAGDILVKPGSHAVIVVEREDDARFLIWESTSVVNGCRERSIDITDGAWDAYSPRRYEGLATGTQPMVQDFPRRKFPAVTLVRDRIVLQSTFAWYGTAALYSLRGERLISTLCSVENGAPAGITIHGAAGVRIIRLGSDEGEVSVLSVNGLTGSGPK
ncbi:MAG: C40 family peptidase [Chitinispirillaceae bacterium]|nr:C40 family peptidase [Chitinispirillaceae bacterium]